MSHKNFIAYKTFTIFCFFTLISFGANAQTVTKTWNASGSVTVDGCGTYCNLGGIGSVSFSAGDFNNGCVITDVNVSIRWHKTGGTCANPDLGNPFHGETNFRIDGPSNNVILATAGTWSGTAVLFSDVTTTFNQGFGVPSGTPITGNFGPNGGNLNTFNGTNPVGTWKLKPGDNGNSDPLCIAGYSVTITASKPNDDCTDATGLGLPSSVSGNTTGCANPNTAPFCGTSNGAGGGVWYSVVGTGNNITASLCGSSYDTKIRVYDGTCGALSCVTGIDDFCGLQSQVNWCSTNGTTYYILVHGFSTSEGNFSLALSQNSVSPTISCPSNITVNNTNGTCGTVVNYTTPSGADDCPGQSTAQIAGLASGSTFPIGTTTNTFRVTDAAGNTADCSFTVTVNDNQNPSILCPSNITVNNTNGTCGAVVNYTTPSGTDNCPGQSTAQIAGLTSGSTFPIGSTTNTFRVTDASNNTTDCSFTVIVTDAENPQISCPANITSNNDIGVCGAVVNYVTPTGTDNCPGQTTTQIAGLPNGSTFPIGTTTNTFEVTDASNNNTATCSFSVTINDTENPQITCPGNIAVDNDAGVCGAVVNYTAPIGTDNCPAQTTLQIAGLVSGSTFPIGTTTNIFRVTDASNNTTDCSFTVIVTDAENPQISCPANINVATSVGVCEAPVTYTTPVGTDNCPGQTTVQTAGLASGDDFPLGITTNTFEVTDAAGNTATCSFDVEVTLDGVGLALDLVANTACINEGILTNQTGGSPVIGTYPGDSGVYSGLGVTNNGNGSFNFDPSIPGLGIHSIAYTYDDGAGCIYFITTDIEIFEGPSASITCPDVIMKDCQGPFNCSATDINPATLPLSTGSVSGSAAAYVYGDPNPGGDLFIDLPNMPTDIEFELIYTLTSLDGCTSTASCTFEITGKQANAGKY
jgi:hypothetical protein